MYVPWFMEILDAEYIRSRFSGMNMVLLIDLGGVQTLTWKEVKANRSHRTIIRILDRILADRNSNLRDVYKEKVVGQEATESV